MMSSLLIIAIVVLIIQVVMFFFIKGRKQSLEFPSPMARKYQIRTRSDAWRMLNNPDISDTERTEIEELYKSM